MKKNECTTKRADLIIAEQKAEALYKADPSNEEKFLNWYNLSAELSRARYDGMNKGQSQ